MSRISLTKSILVVVVVLIVAGGIYAWSQMNQSPEPQPTPNSSPPPTPTPTPEPLPVAEVPEDWLTYRNQEFGFELRFPTFWQNNPGPLPYVFLFGPPGESNDYRVQVWVTPESNLDKFYEDKTERCSKLLVSGRESYRCEGEGMIASERGVDVSYEVKSIYIETKHNGMFYFFSVKGDKNAERFVIFDSMVSTFRFTP